MERVGFSLKWSVKLLVTVNFSVGMMMLVKIMLFCVLCMYANRTDILSHEIILNGYPQQWLLYGLGSGIFIITTAALRNTGSAGLSLVWLLGGASSLLGFGVCFENLCVYVLANAWAVIEIASNRLWEARGQCHRLPDQMEAKETSSRGPELGEVTESRRDGQSEVKVVSGGLSLQRTVTLLGAVSFNVGTMIGSGIFITPTSVLRNTGSTGLNLIVWALGGVLSLLGSLTVSELACRVPKHGGMYAYLNEGFGSWLAFVFAYKIVLFDQPSSLAVKTLTFARYFANSFDLCGTPATLVSLVAVTIIVTLCVLNMASNRATVRLNIVLLYAKVLALVTIIIGGLYSLAAGEGGASDLSKGFEGTVHNPASIATSFYFVMFSYSGWAGANNIVEEVKNPKRNVPLASLLSVFLVTCIYVLTNISYLAVMSRQEMLSSDTVAMTWGYNVLGRGIASLIIPICVMMSTFGSANSGIFAAPRLIFSAARDHNLPEVLSYIHVTKYTPIPATLLMISLAVLFASVSDIVTLIRIFSMGDWFFYFLCAVALLIIRYKQRSKDIDVPFKQPVFVPLLFMLLSLYLTVVPQVTGDTRNLLWVSVFMAVPFIIYVLFKPLRNRITTCDGPVMCLQLLLKVAPPAPYMASK